MKHFFFLFKKKTLKVYFRINFFMFSNMLFFFLLNWYLTLILKWILQWISKQAASFTSG